MCIAASDCPLRLRAVGVGVPSTRLAARVLGGKVKSTVLIQKFTTDSTDIPRRLRTQLEVSISASDRKAVSLIE